MFSNPAAFSITTGLLVAFAAWVIYIRTRAHGTESNVPLVYYALIVYYVVGWSDSTALPPSLVYGSLVLALLLRFEFMSGAFMKVVATIECCALTTIIYFNLSTMFGWT